MVHRSGLDISFVRNECLTNVLCQMFELSKHLFCPKVSHSTAVRSVRIKYSNVKKPRNATSHAHFFNFSQVSFIFLIYVSLFTQILALYLITPCLCLSLFLKRKLQANSQDPIPTYIFLAPGLLCFDQISQFLKKIPILTKFHNFDQISQF